MNTYIVHRGPNPEKVEADLVTIESGCSAAFWCYREVPRPGMRVPRMEKKLVSFFQDVDKITLEEPAPETPAPWAETEMERVVTLLDRCRRLESQYKRMTPNNLDNAMRGLKLSLDHLKPLHDRLNEQLAERNEDDDEDEF